MGVKKMCWTGQTQSLAAHAGALLGAKNEMGSWAVMPAMQTLSNLPFLLGSRDLTEKSFPWCRKLHFMVPGVFMAPCTETINVHRGSRGRGGLRSWPCSLKLCCFPSSLLQSGYFYHLGCSFYLLFLSCVTDYS